MKMWSDQLSGRIQAPNQILKKITNDIFDKIIRNSYNKYRCALSNHVTTWNKNYIIEQ